MLLHSKILGSSANEILILHGFLGSGDNWISIAKKIQMMLTIKRITSFSNLGSAP